MPGKLIMRLLRQLSSVLQKLWQKNWRPGDIHVNCIAPGFIETPMTEGMSESQKEAALAKIPLGRMGSPLEIAQAVLFLASAWSDYITGQVFAIDGGMV